MLRYRKDRDGGTRRYIFHPDGLLLMIDLQSGSIKQEIPEPCFEFRSEDMELEELLTDVNVFGWIKLFIEQWHLAHESR